MFLWFAGLTTAQQVYAGIAVLCNILLLLQVLCLLFGSAVQRKKRIPSCSILAMLTIGGWSGLLFFELGRSPYISIPLSVMFGVGAFFLASYLVRCVDNAQEIVFISPADVVGMQGVVFLSVPDRCKGEGKVLFAIADDSVELAAVTTADHPICSGTKVTATAIDAQGRLVVRDAHAPQKNEQKL